MEVSATRKQTRKLIRKQMQFYFSDANLNRDNFMRKAISSSPDGFMELSIFMNFNKIRKSAHDLKFLAKALRKSKELQLNDEETAVKRIEPMKEIENSDDRIVYVEFLPPNATHDWITGIFSLAGNVAYVSLPRYPTTGDIKQFAFVEFSTPDEAQHACEKLNNPPSDAPEKIGKFPAWNKTLYALTRQVHFTAPETLANDGDNKSQKRQLDNEEELVGTYQGKRRKLDSESSDDSETETTTKSCIDDIDLPKLRVIPKTRWLELKSEYIELQKTNMAKLKKTLNKAKRKESKEYINAQTNEITEITNESETKIKDKKTGPEFMPNVIVKIESSTPLSKQSIKTEFGIKCNIAYVEISIDEMCAYVRCKDTFSAEMIVNSGKEEHQSKLLQGTEEENYWKKLADDRHTTLSTNSQRRKKKSKPKVSSKKTYFDE